MRYFQLDFIRGIAILLMMVFHLCFDLNIFHFIDIDIYNREGRDWFYFRMIILTLFISCVGISLALANEEKTEIRKVAKRFMQLSFFSILITVASYIIFPQTWIYFGVLHFIALASLMALLFVRLEWIALLLGVMIVALFNLDIINMHWLYELLKGALNLPARTEDLVPLLPWFGVVLIGIIIGKKRLFLFPLSSNKFTKFISLSGKHSLVIYLLHQPLFFGIIAGLDWILH